MLSLRMQAVFPTRRSSDLRSATRRSRAGTPQPRTPDGDHRGQLPQTPCQPLPALPPRATRTAWLRSEEHTSELQSLRHFVCRLLLETKNRQLLTFVVSWYP